MKSQARILIVDDDPIAIHLLYAALEETGEIYFATGGQQALAMLSLHPADLVLLDAQMPVMDGFTTCAAIHRDYPEVPVIFITAASDLTSEIRALEAGAVDFISKPISPPVVRARVSAHLKLKEQSDQLRTLVTRDPLTGIANRRFLDERTMSEWQRAQRSGAPLSMLFIDIDDFKAYNDRYGHVQGDSCLIQVAQVIDRSANRAGDLAARYGGEEFAVLLPASTPTQAAIVAEKICEAVRLLAIPHDRSRANRVVTISIGVAGGVPVFAGKEEMESADTVAAATDEGFRAARDLFDRADRALYAAKSSGRNCVRVDPNSVKADD